MRTIRDPYLKNIVRTSSVIFDMPLRLLDTSEEFPANLLSAVSRRPSLSQLSTEIEQAFMKIQQALPQKNHQVRLIGLSADSSYSGVYLSEVPLGGTGRSSDVVIINPFKILRDVRTDLQVHGLDRSVESSVMAEDLTETLLHELVHREVMHDFDDPHDTTFQKALQACRDILESTRSSTTRQFLTLLRENLNGQPIIAHIGDVLDQLRTFYPDQENPAYRPSEFGPQRADLSRGESARSDAGTSGRVRSEGPIREVRAGEADQRGHQASRSSVQRSGAVEEPSGTIDPPTTNARLKSVMSALRPYLLGALGLEQLSQVYGHEYAKVRSYNLVTVTCPFDSLVDSCPRISACRLQLSPVGWVPLWRWVEGSVD